MNIPNLSSRVLVTGADGFIGLNTTLRLLQLGYYVHTTTRTKAQEESIRKTLSIHLDASNLKVIQTDLLLGGDTFAYRMKSLNATLFQFFIRLV